MTIGKDCFFRLAKIWIISSETTNNGQLWTKIILGCGQVFSLFYNLVGYIVYIFLQTRIVKLHILLSESYGRWFFLSNINCFLFILQNIELQHTGTYTYIIHVIFLDQGCIDLRLCSHGNQTSLGIETNLDKQTIPCRLLNLLSLVLCLNKLVIGWMKRCF